MSGENKTKIFFGKCLVISKKLSNFAEQNRNNSHLGCLIRPKRKDAGAVDRDGLENRCTLTGTQGSNPCLSAHKGLQVDDLQTFYHKSKQEHTDARSRQRPEL